MTVNAKDLVKQQKKKDKEKNIIYKKVYERIDKKILMASNKNYYQCLYELPEFMLGLPLYNIDECIKYIDNILVNNGFKTNWTNNKVLISWEVDDD
ncbi:hypothetical protein crov168 [Cafeteria roenbergensis virus]|uniref:Uncharacterized protein n=1 Tax=Cafeteria roenbergensis virus (strain BV-PW1) TaxID=693272 RepID=E3T4T8_CROVB|nr:hypothetical protein crov168 [Cafeteria roenbergensis virus BV-PW1]ADO67201.1 hypothetical protein crov168 [Cafeteria roenbergensis virus BV-PW1]